MDRIRFEQKKRIYYFKTFAAIIKVFTNKALFAIITNKNSIFINAI